jgi:predicted DCC family thiol-disulfide oxidoreductase YuxK
MLKQRLKEIFSLDYRSLALMRISIGIILILDLIERARSLTAHYTDLGVLPRAHFLELFNNPWLISLHHMSGTAFFEGILFIIAFVFAVCLLIGYRTTLATIVSWFLVISLQNRNPLIIQGGDVILRAIMFWVMFLPWGARWSMDNFLNRQTPATEKTTFSAATVAYMIQIFMFYFFSGILKTGAQWHDGTAIYYALSIDQFTTMFGYFILGFPKFLAFMTKATLVLETYGPFLFFIPIFNPWFRFAGVVLFAILQIGINMSMSIGLFGAICIVITFGLLPSLFWDKIMASISFRKKSGLTIYYDKDCGFCTRSVFYISRFLFLSKETKILPAQTDPAIESVMEENDSWVIVDERGRQFLRFAGLTSVLRFSPLWWILVPIFRLPGIRDIGEYAYRSVAEKRLKICLPPKFQKETEKTLRQKKIKKNAKNIFVGAFLVYIILWNIDSLPSTPKKYIPDSIKPVAWVTRMDQKFDMFAPYPLIDDGWYVIPGKLKNGTEIDVYKNGGSVNYGKPPLVSRTYMDQRWQKYMMNLWSSNYSAYRLYYGQYLCRTWNNSHTENDRKLENFKIIYMREDTLPDYQTPTVVPTTIWEHYCFK